MCKYSIEFELLARRKGMTGEEYAAWLKENGLAYDAPQPVGDGCSKLVEKLKEKINNMSQEELQKKVGRTRPL